MVHLIEAFIKVRVQLVETFIKAGGQLVEASIVRRSSFAPQAARAALPGRSLLTADDVLVERLQFLIGVEVDHQAALLALPPEADLGA